MPLSDRLHLATAGLRHFFLGIDDHSLHSPFLYSFYQSVIRPSRKPQALFAPWEALRQQWKHDPQVIEVTDFGAGSHRTGGTRRHISQIARTSLTPARYSRLWHYLIRHLHLQQAAELGTSLGINTLYLRQALPPTAQLHTFEGCPRLLSWAQRHFQDHATAPITPHLGNLDDTWPAFLAGQPSLDFVYLDANHREEATVRYFESCLPCLSEKAVVVVDDIYWSRGMYRAWQHLAHHPRVRMALDLYQTGILFLDPSLPVARERLLV